MEKKPYSDSRWWDNPQPKDVKCDFCQNHLGDLKCKAFGGERALDEAIVNDDRNAICNPKNGMKFEPN